MAHNGTKYAIADMFCKRLNRVLLFPATSRPLKMTKTRCGVRSLPLMCSFDTFPTPDQRGFLEPITPALHLWYKRQSAYPAHPTEMFTPFPWHMDQKNVASHDR
jgi:hypothetical protein